MACQVGPFHPKLIQINLQMNCIAKQKCTDESQKLETRRRDHTIRAKSKYNIYFCILCLCIILCDTRKASENLTFILKQSLVLSSFGVIIVTRPKGDSHQDLIRFDNKKRTK